MKGLGVWGVGKARQKCRRGEEKGGRRMAERRRIDVERRGSILSRGLRKGTRRLKYSSVLSRG